jgi:hypothetical protein
MPMASRCGNWQVSLALSMRSIKKESANDMVSEIELSEIELSIKIEFIIGQRRLHSENFSWVPPNC